MKGFIEVSLKNGDGVQLVNLKNTESFTRLYDGCLIHCVSGTTVTVNEPYDQIKELIKQAQ